MRFDRNPITWLSGVTLILGVCNFTASGLKSALESSAGRSWIPARVCRGTFAPAKAKANCPARGLYRGDAKR